MQPIKYGMFIMPYHLAGKPLAQCYDEDLELAIRVKELGFSELWVGEHHTINYEASQGQGRIPSILTSRVHVSGAVEVAGRVGLPRDALFEHGVEGAQKLAHASYQGYFLGLASCTPTLVVMSDNRITW